MSIKNSARKLLDKFRAKLDYKYELRQFDVIMRVTTYEGEQIGEGNSTFEDVPVVIKGLYRPKVKNLTTQDIINSGNVFSDLDIRVGPFTPPFTYADGTEGGNKISDFDPTYDTDKNLEIRYRVTGPGLENGGWFKKLKLEADGNFGYYLILRKD